MRRLLNRERRQAPGPRCEKVLIVRKNGKFNLSPKRSTHICTSLAGQPVGLTEVEEKMWRLQFLDIILGHYDEENKQFSPMKEIVLL